MTHVYLASLGLGLGLFAGCGDNDDLVCAPGTFQNGKNCVATDPNDAKPPVTVASPFPGRRRTKTPIVTIRADEPGKIVFTTDGSEPSPLSAGEPDPVVIPLTADTTVIKFFGVDVNGNIEATHTETWEYDYKGPGPVTNLAVTGSGTTANITWTNPTDADYQGTLIARVTDIVDTGPVDGMTYAVAASLSTSVQVVGSGSALAQLSDPSRPAGPARYVVWAYDDLGNYGPPTLVEGSVGTLNTAATFTYDTGTQTLTSTVTPASVDLTGTTADYAGSTVTLHLKIKNLTAYYFQNPKALVVSVTNASFSGSDGTADTKEFELLGRAFFAPGATIDKDLTFTGAGGSTVVTIELALGHHSSIISSGPNGRRGSSGIRRFVDLGSGVAWNDLQLASRGRQDRANGLTRQPVLTGHRFLDLATTHGIERWDMTTLTMVSTRFGGKNVMSLTHDGRGNLYALVGFSRREGDVTLYRLDESLTIQGTLDLPQRGGNAFNRSALSPDGGTYAYPTANAVVLVDTKTMTIKDADPSTPEVDTVDVPFGDRIRSVTFFNGSSGVVALFRSNNGAVIKYGTGAPTVTEFSTSGRNHNAVTASDGRVWIASDSDTYIYTPGTGAITTSAYPNDVAAMGLIENQVWVLRSDRTTVDQVDDTGAVAKTHTLGAQSGYSHWIGDTN